MLRIVKALLVFVIALGMGVLTALYFMQFGLWSSLILILVSSLTYCWGLYHGFKEHDGWEPVDLDRLDRKQGRHKP